MDVAIAEREQLETRYKDAQTGKATSDVSDRIEAAIVDADCKVAATTDKYDPAAAALAEAEQATVEAEGAVAEVEGLWLRCGTSGLLQAGTPTVHGQCDVLGIKSR